ncbi:glycolipid 2-alpha-mannosyltransferase [Apiospora sp. TS-2023a]
MVRRSSLGATTPSTKKRRRWSTPTKGTRGNEDDVDELANTPASNEIRFLSLRQVLDDRVKRRIRRHGLSEEMNVIQSEQKQRATQEKTELERLRSELAEKDDEIERLKDVTFLQDTSRIHDLEQQVEHLRSELGNRSSTLVDQTQYDWTTAARDPFSDSYMGDDGDGFGDVTMGELLCSTPSRARASASFPSPPCTSPTIPTSPCSIRRKSPTPTTSHVSASVQASLPDPEKEALEAELGSLRLELTKLTDALGSHDTLKSRIAGKLATAQTVPNSEHEPDLEAHLDTVLQSLSDRTAALQDLNASLGALGFRGGDAGEIVASLASAFRAARLELEYLTPGEITLPLSSRGAEVLDLVLTRLRDLARKTREHEDAIDEYHELELSLRQQLGARVGAMDHLRREVAQGAAQIRDRDARIAELEVGVDRLRGAADGYRRDVGELEALVQRLDAERTAALDDMEHRFQHQRAETADRHDAAVRELEARLDAVVAQAAELRVQTASLNRAHGQGLALRDARVTELRGEIDGINESLRGAHETIRQLRRARVREARGLGAVERMQAELERVLAATTPKKPLRRSSRGKSAVSTPDAEQQQQQEQIRPGGFLSGGLARSSGQVKRRRRYDSGLGLLEEDMDI